MRLGVGVDRCRVFNSYARIQPSKQTYSHWWASNFSIDWITKLAKHTRIPSMLDFISTTSALRCRKFYKIWNCVMQFTIDFAVIASSCSHCSTWLLCMHADILRRFAPQMSFIVCVGQQTNALRRTSPRNILCRTSSGILRRVRRFDQINIKQSLTKLCSRRWKNGCFDHKCKKVPPS